MQLDRLEPVAVTLRAPVAGLLFITYSGALGGAERVLLDCAEAVDGVHWLACPEGELAHSARAAGHAVFTIAARRTQVRASAQDRILAPARLLSHGRELRALAAELDPDTVIAWGMRSAIAAMWLGRPVVFAHNDLLPGPVVGVLVRAAAARARVVIVPSRTVAADLDPRGRLRDRLRIVSPGVDLDRFAPVGDPAQPPEVLVLGAVVGWKRPDIALEACALARRSVPGLRLRVVGSPVVADDPTPSQLRRRAAEPDLAGAVELEPTNGTPERDLARATCLLHCAGHEPFGLVVAEALAAGRPVIVPDAGGPAEIVDESCALSYPAGSSAAAAQALIALLQDPELAASMGRAGRQRAQRHLDRRDSSERFRLLFGELMGQPGAVAGRRTGGAVADQLTLVTVTHNSASALAALLASADRHLPGVPVVVVDNASVDDSIAVAAKHPNVSLVALERNVGFGRACNAGLVAVRSAVAGLVNPDVELLDGSLAALVSEAARTDLPARLLAPLVLSSDGTRQDTVHPVPSSGPDLLRVAVPRALAPTSVDPFKATAPRRVGWAVGCALVAASEVLRELGPFDESIFMYGEDLELGLRAAERGIETWFWPDARVLHHGRHSSSSAFGGEPFEQLARARRDVVSRRLGTGRARLDDAAQALTFASRVALKAALGRPAGRERLQLRALLRSRGR